MGGARTADIADIAETPHAASPARAQSVARTFPRALALANARDAPLASALARELMSRHVAE